MKYVHTSRSTGLPEAGLSDPNGFYYRSIHLTSSENGSFVMEDGRHLSPLAFANLRYSHPGDIVVDGEVHCDLSDCY